MSSAQSNIILETIEEYNRYRAPEAKAKMISVTSNKFKIEFTGSLCYTCGFYDYFEDYRIMLEEKGLVTRIVEIEELDEGAIVTFQVVSREE